MSHAASEVEHHLKITIGQLIEALHKFATLIRFRLRISRMGDAIHDGKYVNESFALELVNAVADMVSERLGGKGIQWLTHVPSLKRPNLVHDFAAAVAARLGNAHVPLLAKRDNAQQKAMQNSFRQAANAIAGLELSGTPPNAPGLLLDDIVSSRWTLTVAGYLLRSAGSGPLYPVVLADASHWS